MFFGVVRPRRGSRVRRRGVVLGDGLGWRVWGGVRRRVRLLMTTWIESLNRNDGMAPWGTIPSPPNWGFRVLVADVGRKMIRKGSQSLTKQFATSLAPLLPTSVTEIWEPSRDFAHVKLPAKSSGNKAGCLVGMSKEEPNIFVVTADGEFLNYKVDLIQGGEGKLDKQYSYLPPPFLFR
jgi:hypothetical protein